MNYIRDDLGSGTSVIVSNSNEFVEVLILYIKTQHLLINGNITRKVSLNLISIITGSLQFRK